MTDLQLHWQQVIAARADYEHAAYPVSQWKRDALAGKTRKGYAEIVAALLVENRTPIPQALYAFRPKTTAGKSLQRAAIAEFVENLACTVSKANGHGWFAMRHAFENLMPFIVAKLDDSFVVAQDNDENRKDLRELCAEILYEWDGASVPRYNEM